jgi:hypothetical protein
MISIFAHSNLIKAYIMFGCLLDRLFMYSITQLTKRQCLLLRTIEAFIDPKIKKPELKGTPLKLILKISYEDFIPFIAFHPHRSIDRRFLSQIEVPLSHKGRE